jgi:hypothetical protein
MAHHLGLRFRLVSRELSNFDHGRYLKREMRREMNFRDGRAESISHQFDDSRVQCGGAATAAAAENHSSLPILTQADNHPIEWHMYVLMDNMQGFPYGPNRHQA